MKKMSVIGMILSTLFCFQVVACVGSADPQAGADEEQRSAEQSDPGNAEASDEGVGEAEQAVCGPGFPSTCTGWQSGSYRCLANCTGINYWVDTGAAYAYGGPDACYYIDYGSCTGTAVNYCASLGRGYQGACWGHR